MKSIAFALVSTLLATSPIFTDQMINDITPVEIRSGINKLEVTFNSLEEIEDWDWNDFEELIDRMWDNVDPKSFKLTFKIEIKKEGTTKNEESMGNSAKVEIYDMESKEELIKEAKDGLEGLFEIIKMMGK